MSEGTKIWSKAIQSTENDKLWWEKWTRDTDNILLTNSEHRQL